MAYGRHRTSRDLISIALLPAADRKPAAARIPAGGFVRRFLLCQTHRLKQNAAANVTGPLYTTKSLARTKIHDLPNRQFIYQEPNLTIQNKIDPGLTNKGIIVGQFVMFKSGYLYLVLLELFRLIVALVLLDPNKVQYDRNSDRHAP